MKSHRTRGFTLIEVMIALALSMIIIGVVAYGFTTTSRATARGLETNRLHEHAATLYQTLQRDLANRAPGTELFIGNDGGEHTLQFKILRPRRAEFGDSDYSDQTTSTVRYRIPMTTPGINLNNSTMASHGTSEFSIIREEDRENNNDYKSMRLLHYPAPASGDHLWLPANRGIALCNVSGEVVKIKRGTDDGLNGDDQMFDYNDPTNPFSASDFGLDGGTSDDVQIKWISNAYGKLHPYFTARNITTGVSSAYIPDRGGNVAFDANAPVYLRIHVPFVKTPTGEMPTLPSTVTNATDDAAKRVFSRMITLDGGRSAFAWYFKL